MSLVAALLEVPRSARDWALWSFNNRACCDEINQAVQTQYSVNLPRYPLDPIPFNNFAQWLAWNQQTHTGFNGVLGLQGTDLEALDPTNVQQLEAWVYLNYQELFAARARLRI